MMQKRGDEMISTILFIAILFSGAVWGNVVFNKKIEDSFPVACMSVPLLLFAFGFFDRLKTGMIAIIMTACCMYLYSLLYLH